MSDDRFDASSNTCHLSTPEEATCTHILVFPTSTTTQSQGTYQIDTIESNLEEVDLLQALEAEGGPDGLEVDDLFGVDGWGDSPEADSRGQNHPDSPTFRQSGFDVNGSMKVCYFGLVCIYAFYLGTCY